MGVLVLHWGDYRTRRLPVFFPLVYLSGIQYLPRLAVFGATGFVVGLCAQAVAFAQSSAT
jgi:hypothetical protein